MINIFYTIILCFCMFLNCWASEKAINLIIINDFLEQFDQEKVIQAAALDFNNALVEKQLIMPSKSLVYTFQRVANYVQTHLDTDFKDLNFIYEQFKEGRIDLLQAQKLIKGSFLDDQTKRAFSIFMTFQDIVKSDRYIVKQVSEDYLLFIDKNNFNEHNLDAELGLKVSELPNYDFKFIPSISVIDYERNFSKGISLPISDSDLEWGRSSDIYAGKAKYLSWNPDVEKTIGQRLIDALHSIKSDQSDHMMNVFLLGHGSEDNMVAEISILKKNKNSDSDFVKFLKLLQTDFLMKSFSLTSCYSGGLKNKKVFNLTNQFNNADLESIAYPMIIRGSFFTEVSMIIDSEESIWQSYFDDLNQMPPNYASAAKRHFFRDGFSKDPYWANLASIKMPHTSWFTPEAFDKKMQKITQIQASTKQKIYLKSGVEIVLLSANEIDSVIVSGPSVPKFFPVNYMKQQYVINSLKISKNLSTHPIQTDPHTLAKSFLSLVGIKEPIDTVIDEVYYEDKLICTNLYCFNYLDFGPKRGYQSGYVYTDENGKMFVHHWPYAYDSSLTVKSGETEILDIRSQNYFEEKIRNVKYDLRPAVKDIHELKYNIEKRSEPKFKLPQKVAESKKMVETESQHTWKKDPVTKKWKFQKKVINTEKQQNKTLESMPTQNFQDFDVVQ